MKNYLRVKTGDYDVELLIENDAALRCGIKVVKQFFQDCEAEITLKERIRDIDKGIEGKTEQELDEYLKARGVKIQNNG